MGLTQAKVQVRLVQGCAGLLIPAWQQKAPDHPRHRLGKGLVATDLVHLAVDSTAL